MTRNETRPLARRSIEADPEHALIAEVEADPTGKDAWSALSVWYRINHRSPFLAMVERRSHDTLVRGCRSGAYGTLEAALKFFNPTALTDTLRERVPIDHASRWPDTNTLNMQRAAARRAERRYMGELDLVSVAHWLYPEADACDYAELLRLDFGLPYNQTVAALDEPQPEGWAAGFIKAMRYFDRVAWSHDKAKGARA